MAEICQFPFKTHRYRVSQAIFSGWKGRIWEFPPKMVVPGVQNRPRNRLSQGTPYGKAAEPLFIWGRPLKRGAGPGKTHFFWRPPLKIGAGPIYSGPEWQKYANSLSKPIGTGSPQPFLVDLKAKTDKSQYNWRFRGPKTARGTG